MNLFTLMPNKITKLLLASMVILMTLALVFIYGASQWFLLAIVTAIALVLSTKAEINLSSSTMQRIVKMLISIRNGDLECRISHIQKDDHFYALAWLLNSAIDQIEAVMRESALSFIAAQRQEYYRKPLIQGIGAGFHHQLDNIAMSIDALASAH